MIESEPAVKAAFSPVLVPQARGGALLSGGAPGNQGWKKRKQKERIDDLTNVGLDLFAARLKAGEATNFELLQLFQINLKLNGGEQVVMIEKPKLVQMFGTAMLDSGLPVEVVRAVGERLQAMMIEQDLELRNDLPGVFNPEG